MVVLDVVDPFHPVAVGQSSPLAGFEGLILDGDYAYVAAGEGGMQVIDISDPALPAVVGDYETRGPAWSITLAGNTVYAAAEDGMHVLDISDPTSPVDLGFFETPGRAVDVTVTGTIAYVAEAYEEDASQVETGGLRIVDVSDPSSPTELGFFPTNPSQVSEFEWLYAPRGVDGVAVAGDHAYLTYSASKGGGMRIADVSDPANPTEIASYEGYIAFVSEVMVVGEPAPDREPLYAYLATDGNAGLLVLDVTDPAQPIVMADEVSGSIEGIDVAGHWLFAADGFGGMHIADISDPALPVEVGSYDTLGIATDVVVSGSTAYVTDGLRDLWVMDISNPVLPLLAGVYTAPGTIKEVTIVEATAYIAAETAGLRVVDVSDPAHPREVGTYDTPGLAHSVHVAEDRAFVGDGQLQVLDVSDPARPDSLAVYEGPQPIREFAFADASIYLPGQALRILDVSDPSHPVEAGTYSTPGWAGVVAIEGENAYLVSDGDLHIVDISSPGDPIQVGKLTLDDLPQWGVQMAVARDQVYVSGESQLRVIDVSDRAAPREDNAINFPGLTIAGLAVSGDCVYVAVGAGGLVVLCQ